MARASSNILPFRAHPPAQVVGRAVQGIDAYARFLTGQEDAHANPAIGAARHPLRLGMWALIAVALVIVIWGMLAPIESAAVAPGNVVLQSNRKTIQHLEGGIIKDIYVREGEVVEAGQPLLRLSDTPSQANVGVLSGQLAVARATEARLIAARDKLDAIVFPDDMVQESTHNPEMNKALATQERLFISQRDSQDAKIRMLKQRIFQSNEEISGLKSQVGAAGGQLALLGQESEAIGKLVSQGLAPKPRLLSLQRREEELKGNRGQYQAAIAKAEQAIAETEMEIINQQNEFEAKNSDELKDVQATIADLTQKMRAASDVADRTVITAPVAGVVMGLKQHTIGGVVGPGTPIMDIVPQDDNLIIEARVSPNDIDIVHQGLPAKVQFTSYKTRRTPKIEGTVIGISADKFTDPAQNTAAQAYYLARIEISKEALSHITPSHRPELYPGMPANVFITTGSRSFLSYLFQPFADSMDKAFREE